MAEYKIADLNELEEIWDMNIRNREGDDRWIHWKDEYIGYNLSGMAKTFVVIIDGKPVGEGTLIISPDCNAVKGHPELADGKNIGNVNALRIIKEHEGKGHISRLVSLLEEYARSLGMTRLTIGVGRDNHRNVSIYKHWGYDKLILSEFDDGEWVDYYEKDI